MKTRIEKQMICRVLLALAVAACGARDNEHRTPPLDVTAYATIGLQGEAPKNDPGVGAPLPTSSASASPIAETIEPVDDMVSIPAATFWMGCSKEDPECQPDEKPRHRVSLAAYEMDRHEVTVRDYLLCVAAKKCPAPVETERADASTHAPCNWKVPGRELHPITCVDDRDAEGYCAWRGKRLPTEAEWEHAARGTDERIMPWGARAGGQPLCRSTESTCPVGSFPAGASPFGVLDMAGNAAEWVSDTYHPAYYAESPARNPIGPVTPIPVRHQACSGSPCATKRGGSWRSKEADLRASARDYDPAGPVLDVGFRCARNTERAAADR